MSADRFDEIMQRYVAMPDCGACEDGEHEDCSHPQGMVQVAVDELAPICCCTDHPLVAVVADLVAEVGRMRVAAGILEKFVKGEDPWGSCVMIEGSMALIDSSWVRMEPAETAYLAALRRNHER